MAICNITPRKCVRTVLSLAFVAFILINIQFFAPARHSEVTPGILSMETIAARKVRTTNISDLKPNAGRGNEDEAVVKPLNGAKPEPEAAIKELIPKIKEKATQSLVPNDSSAQRLSDFNDSLRFIIDDINKKQTIRNIRTFPPNSDGTYGHVLAVQVHNRDHYLRYLIDSLRTTRGVNNSLLIVSHDFYSKEIFDTIANITFMPVIQIFYPLAMQLYKKSYPGPDPADCPRNIKKDQAKKLGCINADYPDKYGHYREAAYAQTKLHWYWKLHHIFDSLRIMKNFTGYVTLIEEDHYLTPDALHVLTKMIAVKQSMCAHCRILTLGNYDKKPSYAYTDEIVVTPEFISSKHNMAMSLNRETYHLIQNNHKLFCTYDDYNWDWSLQHIGREVIPGKLPTMVVKTPRVYHIGDCGVHHKGKKCNPEEKAKPILDRVNVNKAKLFPATLKVGKATSVTYVTYKKLKPNGGWGDKRDHELCSSFMT